MTGEPDLSPLKPLLDDGSPIPARVANRIAEAIADGSYKRGDRIPSSTAIAAHYGLGPQTVSAAFRMLAGEGLLRITPGGTFVAGREP